MRFVNKAPKCDCLKDLRGFKRFLQCGQDKFMDFMKNFLNVEQVRIQADKLNILFDWLQVTELSDVMDVTDRDDEICVVSQIYTDDELIAYFPFVLKGNGVKKYLSLNSFMKKLAEAVSDQITLCYYQHFEGGDWILGENLARLIVANCISSKAYDGIKYAHLMEKMDQLAGSTFEGEFFPTGVIVTSDTSNFKKGLFEFNEKKELDAIDKREWLLANGQESFFLLDTNTNIKGIYRKKIKPSGDFVGEYFDGYYLKNDIKPPDFVIRTVGPNEISVSDSDGKEYVKIENVWRYRHYKNFTQLLNEQVHIDFKVSYAILYYTIWCSRSHISSIIWIPNDCSEKAIAELTTDNRVNIWTRKLNVLEKSQRVLVEKILASDGAVVIDKKGDFIYDSVFADMSKDNTSKARLTGSGETATRLLAQNGVAIKISQDGNIKIYFGTHKICY